MVSNPFQESASVVVNSDTSGFDLSGATSGVLNMKTAAAGLGAALATGTAVALKESASAAADFEAAMADVEKVTDAETAEQLSEPIQELSEELPLAAEEIATLASQAGRFGVEGPEAIEEFTKTAAEMGAATTLAADEAGRSLAKVATALDEPLDNVQALGDSINELSNNFATSSQEIVDAAQRGGFAVQELGLSSDEILGLTSVMNEVAPTARRAGNMLKQMGESLTDPDNVEAFAEAIGVSVEQFEEMRDEDPEETMLAVAEALEESDEASQILSDSLSKQQVRAFSRLSQQTDEFRNAMEMSNRAMEEGGSLSREVGIETDTFRGQMQLLRSEVNNLLRQFGENLLPILRDATTVLSNLASELEGLRVENSELLEEIQETITLFSNLAGTGNNEMNPMIEGIAKIIRITLLARLENLNQMLQLIMNLIQGDFEEAWQNLQNIFENTTQFIRDLGGVFRDGIEAAINDIVTYLRNDAQDDLASGISAVAGFIFREITDRLKILDAFKRAIGSVADYLLGTGEDSALGDITSAITTLGSNIGEALINAIQAGLLEHEINFSVPEQTIDFGRLGEISVGGQEVSLDISPPELQTGGFIEDGGLAMLHAGERVVPEAQVTDRGQIEGGTQRVEIVLDEKTDVVESRIRDGAEVVVRERERRTRRNTGTQWQG